MKKINFSVYDRIDIIFNIFRIRSYNRTVVMVIGFCEFVPFIRNARIENRFDLIVNQPLYVSVCKLRRITFGFTWNRINSQFIDLAVRNRRENNSETKFIEECEPERIILVHI